MESQKITYQFANIGHWLARCNHQTNVIELNANEWDSLSPLMKDYVWVHECVHLLSGETSEKDVNVMSDEIFVSRARSERDRKRRQAFVASANDHSFGKVARPRVDVSFVLMVLLDVIVFLLIKK